MVKSIVIPTAHFKGRWQYLKKITLFFETEKIGVRVQVGDNPEHSRRFGNMESGLDPVHGDPDVRAWLYEMADYLERASSNKDNDG